jgi:hypothetical protein
VGDDPRKEAARRRFDRWSRSYERDRRSRVDARLQDEALAALDLRPGDRSHIRLYRTADLAELLRGAGFVDVDARSLHGGGYAIVRARRVE